MTTAIGLGLLSAAAVFAILYTWLHFFPGSDRHAVPVTYAMAFLAGHAFLEPVVPSAARHWLPYLGLVAMVFGQVSIAPGVHLVERWALYLVLACLTAWFLVPTRPNLEPPRQVYLVSITALVLFLSVTIDPLALRLPGGPFALQLCLTSLCGTLLVAALVSFTIAQAGIVSTGALMGCCGVAFLQPHRNITRALIPAFVVVLTGLMLGGYVYSQQWGLLLIPLTLLALWTCAYGPLSRFRGWPALAVQTCAVGLPLLAVAVHLLLPALYAASEVPQ